MSERSEESRQAESAFSHRLQQLDRQLADTVARIVGDLQQELSERLRQSSDEMVRQVEALTPEIPASFIGAEEIDALNQIVQSQTAGAAADAGSVQQVLAATARIDQQGSQGEILTALVEEACHFASRAAFFLLRSGDVCGWAGHGFDEGAASFRGLQLSYGEGNAWTELAAGQGVVDVGPADAADLAQRVGVAVGQDGVLIPFILQGRVAGALYADHEDGDDALSVESLQLLVHSASQALETLALRNGAASPTLVRRETEAAEGAGLPLWQAPAAEAATVETPIVETPIAEEPIAEEPVAEEPDTDEAAAETPAVEEPAAKEPEIEEPAAEEPEIEEPAAEEPQVEEPAAEEPQIEEPAAEEPEVEEPTAEIPVYQEPAAEAAPAAEVDAEVAEEAPSVEFKTDFEPEDDFEPEAEEAPTELALEEEEPVAEPEPIAVAPIEDHLEELTPPPSEEPVSDIEAGLDDTSDIWALTDDDEDEQAAASDQQVEEPAAAAFDGAVGQQTVRFDVDAFAQQEVTPAVTEPESVEPAPSETVTAPHFEAPAAEPVAEPSFELESEPAAEQPSFELEPEPSFEIDDTPGFELDDGTATPEPSPEPSFELEEPAPTTPSAEAPAAAAPAAEAPPTEVAEPTIEDADEIGTEDPTIMMSRAPAAAPAPPSSYVPPPASAPPPAAPAAGDAGGSAEVLPPADIQGPGSAFAAHPAAGAADMSDSEMALHEEARRLARLLVSEIKLYNEEVIEEGRREGNIYERLRDDIDRSRQMYEERIDTQVSERQDYFHQELVQRLAGGDARLLGI